MREERRGRERRHAQILQRMGEATSAEGPAGNRPTEQKTQVKKPSKTGRKTSARGCLGPRLDREHRSPRVRGDLSSKVQEPREDTGNESELMRRMAPGGLGPRSGSAP